MEVVVTTNFGSEPTSGVVPPPIRDHNVSEWSRIDRLAGVLEKACLETDRWTASTQNSTHQYGKVLNSHTRLNADGAVQQQRQLEVYQSQIPGGRLQVIKTISKMSAKSTDYRQAVSSPHNNSLQLEKSPSVSVVGSRSKFLNHHRDDDPLKTATTNLNKVSRLCHQIHENQVQKTFGKYYNRNLSNLVRTKSSSSEDLMGDDYKNSKTTTTTTTTTSIQSSIENSDRLKRLAKIRRSLQHNKQFYNVEKFSESSDRKSDDDDTIKNHNGETVMEELTRALRSITTTSDFQSRSNLKEDDFENATEPTPIIEEVDDDNKTNSDNNIEEKSNSSNSFIFGMEEGEEEEEEEEKPLNGTRSLESRPKSLYSVYSNGTNEDWYNRRKSYGFEQIRTIDLNQLENKHKILTNLNGITVTTNGNNNNDLEFDNIKSTKITIPIKSSETDENRISKLMIDADDKNLRKKVEFCKTEVHFAADSGKVNIVETDEKPPPTNNFRRKRRNSGTIFDLDMPCLYFGDSSYEQTLLGVKEPIVISSKNNNVTVNTSSTTSQNQIDLIPDDDNRDCDNIKGILKNKPNKPIPYHLGEDPCLDTDPVWKLSGEEPDYKKILRNLRYNKPDLINDSEISMNFNSKKSWENDIKPKENKTYLTKVNFGEKETTVIENNDNQNNKVTDTIGLIVRLGQDDTMKTNTTNKTTTTKITIDLNHPPSKIPRSHSFKSTSLILETLKNKRNQISQQLEALKRLYDDDDDVSDSDSGGIQTTTTISKELPKDEDKSSILSGSWSRMKSYKTTNGFVNKTKSSANLERENFTETVFVNGPNSSNIAKSVNLEYNLKSPNLLRQKDLNESFNKTYKKEESKVLTQSNICNFEGVKRQPRKSELSYFGINVPSTPPQEQSPKQPPRPRVRRNLSPKKSFPIYENVQNLSHSTREFSPVLQELRKTSGEVLKTSKTFTNDNDDEVKTEKPKVIPRKSKIVEKVSSDRNFKSQQQVKVEPINLTAERRKQTTNHSFRETFKSKNDSEPTRSKSPCRKPIQNARSRSKSPEQKFEEPNTQLPSKSPEIPVSPPRRSRSRSPEIINRELKENKMKERIQRTSVEKVDKDLRSKRVESPYRENRNRSKSTAARSKSPEKLKEAKTMDKALRKAESVRGKSTNSTERYSHRECKNLYENVKELKAKNEVSRSPSNISERSRRTSKDHSNNEKVRKKVDDKSIKARRLQRASSREALLQHHGSSSDCEDPSNKERQKPRQVRKTKLAQFSISNGIPMGKKEKIASTLLPGGETTSRPVIVHKPVISTISRERSKSREKVKSGTISNRVATPFPGGDLKKSLKAEQRIPTTTDKKRHR